MIVVCKKDVYFLHYNVYFISILIVSTAVIYFVVASQEYSHLVEFLEVGIQGETQEKQVEIGSFHRRWHCISWIVCLDTKDKTLK
ncbi:MAG: hypothetical protein K0S67_1189 [Nitrososphaeraceae archaeon]|nr:hypothetical protein [Nitrososphaeraceae archaeon]MCD6037301.1 hypothetical protein [Nitrososphaeraceae archaeon]MDF2769466.1 hypothetical protein [Nitrososphaeraceae archaeon]